MTYEMKDFQEDEKTLRKQAKDGEISEEEFFLALKKLHNRATEGDSHLVQLARSIGISEDELFSGEYGDNYDDILTNILQKAGITESIHVPHTGDSDCTNPNCVGARAEDIIFNNFHVPREGGIQCDHCDKHFEEEPEPVFSSAQMLNQPIVHDLLYHAKTHGKESKANEMEEHECDDCGFKSVDYEEYKDHMKSHNKPVGSQGESIATEEEISDGIWLVDEEEQKELDKEKKRKEQNMNIDEDYMRSMGTVSSDEVDPLKVSDGVATEHDSLCPYCSKQIDDDDHWFEHIEKHRNGESRHHEQIDVKKKWLERCEVCGDIRSSHTNGIDHKFEVDATGTEFIDPEYLEGLGESILFKKNVSVEMVRLETMHEAEKWWDETHAGTHGRKYWNDMNIRERQRTILAYLKAVTGYSGQGMPLVENRASGVRKYALENKRIKFENPDPKFWWNDGEARTGTVLNEYKQSGLEWYSVNSGGQIYNVLKDDAELIVSEHLGSEGYVEKDYRNHGAIESDEEAKALLTDLTELDLLEDLKDNEKTEQAKGEDETEDLDLIEQLMDIEEDEIKEKIEEATPNSLIRYANPKKLPNGKTVMDRIRTSHPQVNEHKLHSPIHISQYHQGDFSVTQICTECGQVIRGDPYSVDEESMQHVRETGHNSFKVEVEEAIDVLANVPFTELAELTWTSLSPVLKEKIKQKLSKEYWDDGKPTTTGEWWDMNDYGFKWSVLKGFGSFAKSDELAKAYWRHLPDHVQNVVKRYRQIHFPDALGIEGMSTNKNHNIDTYIEIAFQDFMKGNHSPNNRYEDTAYNKPNWDLGTVGNVDFGEAKANEDSLLKVEEEPEGVDVTVLDEWENKKADENDLEGLIDMYSDTTSIPRNPTYPSEPLGSGANTEECPFCGKLFDEFNLDHHVEEEHGVHTPSQYTQSTIMDNLNDEWLGEAWDKMSAKERRKLLGETKVECSRCGQPLEEDDKKGQDKHAKNRHSEQGQASDNLDIGKVEWVPLGTYKPLYESKGDETQSFVSDISSQNFAFHREWDETQVQCPNCYGDGVFYHNDEGTYWEEMCTICEGSGHIDRSVFQQGTNEESWGITHDWRGQPEILWESKASEVEDDLEDPETDLNCPYCRGDGYYWDSWYDEDDNYQQMRRECEKCREKYPDFYKSDESKASEVNDMEIDNLVSKIKRATRNEIETLARYIGLDPYENNNDSVAMAIKDAYTHDKDLPENEKWNNDSDMSFFKSVVGEAYSEERDCEQCGGNIIQCPYCRENNHEYEFNEDRFGEKTICPSCGKDVGGSDYDRTIEDEVRMKNPYNLGESKATEGGFGSGKKGHSAWMKDIEWGGNYKQCPICGINTNFTGGKCEICGNSFA